MMLNIIKDLVKQGQLEGLNIGFVRSTTGIWHIYEDDECCCGIITAQEKRPMVDISFDNFCNRCYHKYFCFKYGWLEKIKKRHLLIYPCTMTVKKRGTKRKCRNSAINSKDVLCPFHKKKMLDKYLTVFPRDVANVVCNFL